MPSFMRLENGQTSTYKLSTCVGRRTHSGLHSQYRWTLESCHKKAIFHHLQVLVVGENWGVLALLEPTAEDFLSVFKNCNEN